MKRIISILLLLGISGFLIAQEKEDFKNKQVCFIIKGRYFQSQKVSDSLTNIHKLQMDEYLSGKNLFPPPQRSIDTFNLRGEDYLLVSAEKIVKYSKPYFKDKHPRYVNLHSLKYTEISRDSLIENKVNLISESKRVNSRKALKYWGLNHYPIISENRDIVKTINGFNCYQVIMKEQVFGTGHLIEAFVTEEIQLEYHPIINVKEYLYRFFPLYLRFYDPNSPKESFREYTFEMYPLAYYVSFP